MTVELKDGLWLREERLSEDGKGPKSLHFSNRTVDKQFIVKYTFRDGSDSVEVGPTAEWVEDGTRLVLCVHPGDEDVLLATTTSSSSRTVAHGPLDAAWVDRTRATLCETAREALRALLVRISSSNFFDAEALQALSSEDVAQFCADASHAAAFADTAAPPADFITPARCFLKPLPASAADAAPRPRGLPAYVSAGRASDPCFAAVLTSLAVSAHYAEASLLNPLAMLVHGINERDVRNLMVRACLFSGGVWRSVLCDAYVPHLVSARYESAAPAYMQTAQYANHAASAFPALLEKVFAREATQGGGYGAMGGEKGTDVRAHYPHMGGLLLDFTGAPHKTFTAAELVGVSGDAQESATQVGESYDMLRRVVLGGGTVTACASSGKREVMYSVVGFNEVTPMDRLIKLRDPAASWDACATGGDADSAGNESMANLSSMSGISLQQGSPALGPWGIEDLSAAYLYKEDKARGEDTRGVFYMDFSAFVRGFTAVHVAYTNLDLETISTRGAWGIPAADDAGDAAPSQHVGFSLQHSVGEGDEQKVWVGLVQDGSRLLKLSHVNLYVTSVETSKKGTVKRKVLESVTCQRSSKFIELTLNAATRGKRIFVVPQIKKDALQESQDLKGYGLVLHLPTAVAKGCLVDVEFLRWAPKGGDELCDYTSAKEVSPDDWQTSPEQAFQLRGLNLAAQTENSRLEHTDTFVSSRVPIVWARAGTLLPQLETSDDEIERLAMSKGFTRQNSSVHPNNAANDEVAAAVAASVAVAASRQGSLHPSREGSPFGVPYWEAEEEEEAGVPAATTAAAASAASVPPGAAAAPAASSPEAVEAVPEADARPITYVGDDSDDSLEAATAEAIAATAAVAAAESAAAAAAGPRHADPDASAPLDDVLQQFSGNKNYYNYGGAGEGEAAAAAAAAAAQQPKSGSPIAWNDDLEDVVTRKPRKSLIETMKDMEGSTGVAEVRVELSVVSAANLIKKGSTSPFCEVKLRTVDPRSKAVASSHANPQKKTTKVVSNNLESPTWNEHFNFVVPVPDCVRVSIFGKRTLGTKVFLGRVDVLSDEMLLKATVNGPPVTAVVPIQGDEHSKDRTAVTGSLTVSYRIISVR